MSDGLAIIGVFLLLLATADPDDDLLCWPCQEGLDEH